MMHGKVRGISCKTNVYTSSSTSELRFRLAPCNQFKPSSKIVLLIVLRRYLFCGSFVLHVVYLVFDMLSRPFIAALWLPVEKGLASWLWFVMFKCVFVTFLCGILGQDCIDS